MSYQDIENEMQEKGLTAPRITPADIESKIFSEEFILQPAGTTLTICILMLKNGYTVTGESACASPENFDQDMGMKIARKNAADKVWTLEGYLLKEKLFTGEL
ncbi:hypothetical protein HN803_02400 [candidate division WWE3 bacterium]|jgi:hypothetical protein|nr:hypothetical protein [candidate division WWE3 bacterium]